MAQTPERVGGTIADENKRGYKAGGLLGRRGLLVVLSGPRLGQSRVVGPEALVVGRQADCGLAVDDPLLSRQHFRIRPAASAGEAEEGEYLLEDLDSRNSTYLNTARTSGPARLHYGDRIVAGATVFRFLLEEQAQRKGAKPQPQP